MVTAAFLSAYPPEDMPARTTPNSWLLLNGVCPAGSLPAGAPGTCPGIRNGPWIMPGCTAAAGLFLLPAALRAAS